jgi:hypothetical protein
MKTRVKWTVSIGLAFSVVLGYASGAGVDLFRVLDRSQYLPGDNLSPQGTLQLIDRVNGDVIELGYYRYGQGLYSSGLFEFYTSGVSVRNQNVDGEPFLAVRDRRDQQDIRFMHNGTEGIITTRGNQYAAPGNILVHTVRFALNPGEDQGLFVDKSGALYYRGPQGTVTRLGEP